MVQTILASLKIRKRGSSPMQDAAAREVITCADGVRLLGNYSAHPDNKALAIFLHGWEGSEDSTYVVSCARHLYEQGASVYRLNFRDHGDSHALNEGLFFATRFDEVMDAVEQIAGREPARPIYLIGYSMGGNFALRVARALKTRPVPNLEHIFSISPVIDPWPAAPLVDQGRLISRYFYKKLTTSLRKKQAHHPHLYDFSELLAQKTVMGISEIMLPQYSGYPDMKSYFDAYAIAPNDLADCETDVSIIMAKDDPIIPAESVDALRLSPQVRHIALDYGGHNGFFQSLLGPTWYDDYISLVMFGPVIFGPLMFGEAA